MLLVGGRDRYSYNATDFLDRIDNLIDSGGNVEDAREHTPSSANLMKAVRKSALKLSALSNSYPPPTMAIKSY